MKKIKWLIGLFILAMGLSSFVFSQAAESYTISLPLIIKNWPPVSTRPPTSVAGRVLFTEIMASPPGAQPDQEWFELYNDGGAAFNLTGYRVGDEEDPNGSEGLMQFPDGTILEISQVVVIARKATAFAAMYGFSPTFEIDETDPLVPNLFKCASACRTNIEFTDSGDEVLLYDPAGDVVDALAWGNSPWSEFDPKISPAAKGHTLERYPAYQDSDSAQDWRDQPAPKPGQANITPPTPTPGPTATPLPFAGKLVISEVMADPLGSEPGEEWIELYNPSTAGYSLTGFKLGDEESAGGSEGMMQFPPGAQINAGQVLVIANQASAFTAAHGFQPNFELTESDANVPNLEKYTAWGTGSINLVNSGDEILLLDGTDHLVDGVAYGDSTYAGFQPPVLAAPAGSSIERYPPAADTNAAADWRIQASPAPGQVDLSTPPTATPLPPLVINEIHADPHLSAGDANGDGVVDTADDEFIEIVNTTGSPIDLSGWALHDSTQLRHTFAASSVIPGNCAVVVFGGGSMSGTFGGSLVVTATTKTLALNNTGDTITLYNASATAVISATYGSDGGDDQALTRSPDILGQFSKHTLPAQAAGRRFSPGMRLDGSPFSGCGGVSQSPLPRKEMEWGVLFLGLMLLPGWWRWRCRQC
jgi:hypothetical protein